jgi:hypothetical protein
MQTAASSKDYAKYNILVIVVSLAMLSAMIFSIFQITDDYKDGHALIDEAIHWQLRTKGTVALSSKHIRTFKNLSGNNFIDKNDVNALVLGSSTMMGVRGKMFPEGWTAHNFSKSDHFLRDTAGEAYYFAEKYENIRWIFIGLDYSLGKAFGGQDIKVYNPAEAEKEATFLGVFSDAITLNRLKITLKNIWSNLFRGDEKYLRPENGSSGEYLCPENDGSGKDFGTVLAPGECWGYRYDGSATFKYHKMSKADWKSQLNEKGLKIYISKLGRSAGKVNQNHLNHLKAINDLLNSRSGGLVLVSPPLMPGAEKLILESRAGKYLQEYHEKLNRWASASHVKLLDAGASEKYGCTSDEFYDGHHALDRCYSKIFDRFFKENRDVL